MDKRCRITIPAELRDLIGLEPKQPLTIKLANNKLIIQDRASLEKDALEFFSKQRRDLGLDNISVVNELIAERREAALSQ